MCLKESYVPEYWKVSSVVPVHKNVGKGLQLETTTLLAFFFVVSNIFEKLVNNRLVDHLEKYGLFSDFQYGFRSP